MNDKTNIEWKNITRQTPIRVVFYGRVSTKHESQLSAFENQIQWYHDQKLYNPNWNVVCPIEKYLDKGITGTQTKKRPGFLEIIKDAKAGKFDMIVTREICRFARNTVDALRYVRELKAIGVQVYFVSDGIRTIEDNDGEQRLTLMASNAQEESRKISERSKNGQLMARQNGVLYGTGNILGYRRIRKRSDYEKKNAIGDKSLPTFAIVPDEAETVRMIFGLYKEGLGLKQIKNNLEIAGRKNSSGKVKWFESSITRLISNPMYIGKQQQCQTEIVDFLEHTVKKNKREDFKLIEGDFEPIIDEELFWEVQRIKQAKTINNHFGDTVYGCRVSEDKWLDKLECGCGSRFEQYKWRTNASTKEDIKGYACKHRVRDGSAEYRAKKGLPTEGACDLPSIPAWKFDFMALKVFKDVFIEKKVYVVDAFQSIADNIKMDKDSQQVAVAQLKSQKDRFQNKIDSLTELFTEGDISKEEYRSKRVDYQKQIEQLEIELHKHKDDKDINTMVEEFMSEVQNTLAQIVDCSGEWVSEDLIRSYIDKIVVRSKSDIEFYMNLRGNAPKYKDKTDARRLNLPYGEKAANTIEMRDNVCHLMMTLYLNFEEARAFKKKFGKYLRSNQWEDILIKVYAR